MGLIGIDLKEEIKDSMPEGTVFLEHDNQEIQIRLLMKVPTDSGTEQDKKEKIPPQFFPQEGGKFFNKGVLRRGKGRGSPSCLSFQILRRQEDRRGDRRPPAFIIADLLG